jgi:hypothetical protein
MEVAGCVGIADSGEWLEKCTAVKMQRIGKTSPK